MTLSIWTGIFGALAVHSFLWMVCAKRDHRFAGSPVVGLPMEFRCACLLVCVLFASLGSKAPDFDTLEFSMVFIGASALLYGLKYGLRRLEACADRKSRMELAAAVERVRAASSRRR